MTTLEARPAVPLTAPASPTLAPAPPSLINYGSEYQRRQLDSYRNRRTNHWRHRLELAHRLFNTYAVPRLGNRAPSRCNVVDVGCSIGTFAIEFARRGYRTVGMDFDADAIALARDLASEEGVSAEFIVGDAGEWDASRGGIDVAVCFDLFEHLHDDELGAMLDRLRRRMSPDGTLIFHTFPNQFDHIFYGSNLCRPLLPFTWLSKRWFYRLSRAYACLHDMTCLLRWGRTPQELAVGTSHCNALTKPRLRLMLERAGFEILELDSATVYEWKPGRRRRFAPHDITHRNIYGAAIPRR